MKSKINLFCLFVALWFSGCSKMNLKDPSEESLDPAVHSGNKMSTMGSAVGDVVGKVTVGYQGWFIAPGDGTLVNQFWHTNMEMWPDMREYTVSYVTPLGNLGNGQPAKMFSSYDQSTVNLHVQWMGESGIDCIALQRFSGDLGDPAFKAQKDGMALKIKTAAEAASKKFYIMYDISGHQGMQTTVQNDWVNSILPANLLSSSAYAKQNGKPVVCIFGLGYKGAPVPGGGDPVACLQLINFFKAQGCYVIGSIPMDWRSPVSGNGGFSRANFASVYDALNMIQPWVVPAEVGPTYQPWIQGDYTYCENHGIDYQPGIYPGTSFHNTNGSTQNLIPRNHGDFMWSQAAVLKTVGVKSLYVAMFDEFNEATQIMKTAENSSMAPTNHWYLNLDADGVAVSSDFYMRLTNDIGKMVVKGTIPYQATHPTPHTIGGAATIPNGTYKIVNRNSGLALDAQGQLTANGTPVVQYAYAGGNNQKWILTSLGGDTYKIVGVQSGKALDVNGQSLADGAKVQLYTDNGGSNQKWVITPTSGGYYTVKSVQSSKVMDVEGNVTTPGALLQQWTGNGGNNQQWAFQAP